jgi:hypothetical protein
MIPILWLNKQWYKRASDLTKVTQPVNVMEPGFDSVLEKVNLLSLLLHVCMGEVSILKYTVPMLFCFLVGVTG